MLPDRFKREQKMAKPSTTIVNWGQPIATKGIRIARSLVIGNRVKRPIPKSPLEIDNMATAIASDKADSYRQA